MKYIFNSEQIRHYDKKAIETYHLSAELLMEHVAMGMKHVIEEHCSSGNILIVCGGGDNGADGLALARLLYSYNVDILLVKEPKSVLCVTQYKRCQAIKARFVDAIYDNYDVIVEAIIGIGHYNTLSLSLQSIITQLNSCHGLKIACDIPCGLGEDICFNADITVSAGGLKRELFEDHVKNSIGKVVVCDVGIDPIYYANTSPWYLLEAKDLSLPFRYDQQTHKGSYGHVAIIVGDHQGAAQLAGEAALSMGAGKVTLVGEVNGVAPFLMTSRSIPNDVNVLIVGTGWGNFIIEESVLENFLLNGGKIVADADICYHKNVPFLLRHPNVIFTPHPKEFMAIVREINLEVTYDDVLYHKCATFQLFMEHNIQATVVLKGANTLIGMNEQYYINTLGSPCLAKGGSGDVLSGIIAAYLAQGYSTLEASLNGTLALSLSANSVDKHNYALTPLDIIEQLGKL